MSRTNKSRREGYDNIKVGSAITTRERTVSGALPPNQTTYGNSENIKVGSAYGAEKHVSKGTALLSGDNVKVGG